MCVIKQRIKKIELIRWEPIDREGENLAESPIAPV